MPPKPFKPILIEEPKEANTVVQSHATPRRPNYGYVMAENASLNYGGVSRTVNCTVNAHELQRAIAAQKVAVAKRIAEHEEYRRVRRGKRTLKHTLPLEEEYGEGGEIKLVRAKTETTRIER